MLNMLELKRKRNQVPAYMEETLKGYIFNIWECNINHVLQWTMMMPKIVS